MSEEQVQKICAEFNAKYPIGTPVKRYVLVNPLQMGSETRTASAACVSPGGQGAVIFVEGVRGFVSLDSIVPLVTPHKAGSVQNNREQDHE